MRFDSHWRRDRAFSFSLPGAGTAILTFGVATRGTTATSTGSGPPSALLVQLVDDDQDIDRTDIAIAVDI
jgi:hypothetical protein